MPSPFAAGSIMAFARLNHTENQLLASVIQIEKPAHEPSPTRWCGLLDHHTRARFPNSGRLRRQPACIQRPCRESVGRWSLQAARSAGGGRHAEALGAGQLDQRAEGALGARGAEGALRAHRRRHGVRGGERALLQEDEPQLARADDRRRRLRAVGVERNRSLPRRQARRGHALARATRGNAPTPTVGWTGRRTTSRL